ncbi:Vascular endothelial growth factor A [Orchesella cincta]|uniref:Vascular endothelial growth factor A n=1 Tax=Orchesella cincta TaxID=48709 RepID=A0A1D2N837_ORCCI|nr:Vascular endothelial growth factor A [Orchesella cincta]
MTTCLFACRLKPFCKSSYHFSSLLRNDLTVKLLHFKMSSIIEMNSKYNTLLVITCILLISVLPAVVNSVPGNFSSAVPFKRSSRSVTRNEYNIQRCVGCNNETPAQCTRKSFKNAKQYADKIKCQPEPTYVQLEVPGPAFSVEPSVAKVNRCSGVCKHGYHSCMPIKTSFIKVPVILSNHHKKGYNCVEYEVMQHDECSCGCQILEEHCSEFHKHDRCACKCTNDAEMMQCLAKQLVPGQRSVWDEDKCECVCEVEPCPEGFEWDSSKCRCERSPWIDEENLLY